MDFDNAIASHIRWKLQLYQWLQGRLPAPMASEVASANRCDLGQVLLSCEGDFQRLGSYRLAKGAHAIFHARAAEVVEAIAAGETPRATTMIAPGTPYAAASNAIVLALAKLQADTRKLEPASYERGRNPPLPVSRPRTCPSSIT